MPEDGRAPENEAGPAAERAPADDRSPREQPTGEALDALPSMWDLPERWRAPDDWDPGAAETSSAPLTAENVAGSPARPQHPPAAAGPEQRAAVEARQTAFPDADTEPPARMAGGGPPTSPAMSARQTARVADASVTDKAHRPPVAGATKRRPGPGTTSPPAIVPVAGDDHRRQRGRRAAAVAILLLILAAAAAITAYAVTRSDASGNDGGTGQPAGDGSGPAAGPGSGSAGIVAGVSPSPSASAADGGASPSPSAAVTPSNAKVPILMYHLISAPPAGAAYPELYVRPAAFARQMDYLDEQGFQAVTLRQVAQAWRGEATLPKRPVVVSFDDGYPSHYQTAAPIMAAYDWKGLINADWKVLSESPRLLAQVKLLGQAGWEIGSHSLTHPDLTTLDAASLEREVAGSRTTLQEKLGVQIETFCYPAGRYNEAVAAAVEKAGYWSATTTDPGLAVKTEPYMLKRIRINGSTSLQGFAEALRNAGV